ncbi:PARP15 [Symbiodinium sp. KB8]|nr:PARP15 [Symbiodinium sp. KB8]
MEDPGTCTPRANEVSFNTGISACEKGSNWLLALELLVTMEAARLRSDVVATSAVLAALAAAGLAQRCFLIQHPALDACRVADMLASWTWMKQWLALLARLHTEQHANGLPEMSEQGNQIRDPQWQLENLEQCYEHALHQTSQQAAAYQNLKREQESLENQYQALEWQLENLEQLYDTALLELSQQGVQYHDLNGQNQCVAYQDLKREQERLENQYQALEWQLENLEQLYDTALLELSQQGAQYHDLNGQNQCVEIVQQPSAVPQYLMKPLWEYLEDLRADEWRPVAEGCLSSIEAAYQSGQSACTMVTSNFSYDVDLHGLVQTNRTTGKRRKLRRRLIVDCEAALKLLEQVGVRDAACLGLKGQRMHLDREIALRDMDVQELQWQVENLERVFRIERLEQLYKQELAEQSDHEKKWMEHLKQKNLIMLSSLPDAETLASTATRSRYFEHSVRERSWDGCTPVQSITAMKCDVEDGHIELNEYLLFHGCSSEAATKIKEQGFDAQREAEGGAMFGQGTYFAQNASKSDFYAFPDYFNSERCVLVARVLLGESKVVTTASPAFHQGESRSRAPERENGQPYDSLSAQTRAQGGSVDHMEFVIFKDQMALLQYVIHYRHKRGCTCHTCST